MSEPQTPYGDPAQRRPRQGERYWYINSLGFAECTNFCGSADETRLRQGNCFIEYDEARAMEPRYRKLFSDHRPPQPFDNPRRLFDTARALRQAQTRWLETRSRDDLRRVKVWEKVLDRELAYIGHALGLPAL